MVAECTDSLGKAARAETALDQSAGNDPSVPRIGANSIDGSAFIDSPNDLQRQPSP